MNHGKVPTQELIKEYLKDHDQDYRFETKPHPVERFRNRNKVPPEH